MLDLTTRADLQRLIDEGLPEKPDFRLQSLRRAQQE